MLKTTSILSALILAGLVGCMDDEDDKGDVRENSRAYIDGIVPHHEMAVMMSDEAMVKAVRPGLKEMAAKMKEDQTREIGQFKQIRANLVGSDVTPDPMPMKEMPAGEAFDKMFLHMMIDHHQGAIDQSILALDAGVQSPLDSLANKAIEAQRMEQAMLNDSLKAWYGETHTVGDGPH